MSGDCFLRGVAASARDLVPEGEGGKGRRGPRGAPVPRLSGSPSGCKPQLGAGVPRAASPLWVSSAAHRPRGGDHDQELPSHPRALTAGGQAPLHPEMCPEVSPALPPTSYLEPPAALDLREGPFLVLRGRRRPGPRRPPGVKNRRCVVHEELFAAGERWLRPAGSRGFIAVIRVWFTRDVAASRRVDLPSCRRRSERTARLPLPGRIGDRQPIARSPPAWMHPGRMVDHHTLTRRPEGESRGPGGRGGLLQPAGQPSVFTSTSLVLLLSQGPFFVLN